MVRCAQQPSCNNVWVSDRQHGQWKFDFNCACRTVLTTGSAMPALIRITNIHHIVFQVNHIQWAVLITSATCTAFFMINYRRHQILLFQHVAGRTKISCRVGFMTRLRISRAFANKVDQGLALFLPHYTQGPFQCRRYIFLIHDAFSMTAESLTDFFIRCT